MTKVGGYACWVNAGARGARGTQKALKGLSHSSGVAEMKAVANALHFAIGAGLVQPNEKVLIQTDCISAIQAFKNQREHLISDEKEIVKWMNNIIFKYNLTVIFKHVKGHTTHQEARFRSNVICDEKAKEEMRKARSLFKLNEIRRKVKESLS